MRSHRPGRGWAGLREVQVTLISFPRFYPKNIPILSIVYYKDFTTRLSYAINPLIQILRKDSHRRSPLDLFISKCTFLDSYRRRHWATRIFHVLFTHTPGVGGEEFYRETYLVCEQGLKRTVCFPFRNSDTRLRYGNK